MPDTEVHQLSVAQINVIVASAVNETLRQRYMSPLDDVCITMKAAAGIMGLSVFCVRDLVKRRVLGSVGRGHLTRIKTSQIQAYYRDHSADSINQTQEDSDGAQD